MLGDPLSDSVRRVLCEALVHHLLVQLDLAIIDVAGAFRDEFSLVGQERERDVVDADGKCV